MPQTVKVLNFILLFSLVLFIVSSVFSISVTTVAVSLAALIWSIQITLTRSWKQVELPLAMPIALYFAACGLSLIFAADFTASLGKMKKLLEPLVFFLMINCLRHPEVIGLAQKPLSLIWKKSPAPGSQEDALAVWTPFLYIWFLAAMVSGLFAYYQIYMEIDLSNDYRATGPLGSAMTFSGLMLMAVVMMTSRLLLGPSRSPGLVLIFLVTLGAFITSYMRSGWLAYFFVTIYLLFIKNRLWAMVAPVLVIGLLVLSPPFIKDRIFTVLPSEGNPEGLLADKSFNERREIWNAGWEIFKENPVVGCGFDCAYNVREQYIQEHPILHRFTALHSNFLQLMVDTGLVGLASWLFIWVRFFQSSYRILKPMDRDAPHLWIAAGSQAAVASFLAVGVVESNFFDTEVALVLFFIMALPFVLPKPAKI